MVHCTAFCYNVPASRSISLLQDPVSAAGSSVLPLSHTVLSQPNLYPLQSSSLPWTRIHFNVWRIDWLELSLTTFSVVITPVSPGMTETFLFNGECVARGYFLPLTL